MASKAPTAVPKGIFLMNVLTEGAMPGGPPATKANLDTWINRAKLPFTTTLDSVAPQVPLEEYFSLERDNFLLIDLATMQLVDIFPADPNGAIAAAEAKLAGM